MHYLNSKKQLANLFLVINEKRYFNYNKGARERGEEDREAGGGEGGRAGPRGRRPVGQGEGAERSGRAGRVQGQRDVPAAAAVGQYGQEGRGRAPRVWQEGQTAGGDTQV